MAVMRSTRPVPDSTSSPLGREPALARRAEDAGIGAVNPQQLERYIENQCFWQSRMPAEAHYFKPWNKAYLAWAVAIGFLDKPEPVFIQLYSETLQKFRLAARGHGDVPVEDVVIKSIKKK